MLRNRERSRSPRQQSFGEEDSGLLTLTDELALVGFTDDVEVSAVFDESGEFGCNERSIGDQANVLLF